jgi:hypothetical protein
MPQLAPVAGSPLRPAFTAQRVLFRELRHTECAYYTVHPQLLNAHQKFPPAVPLLALDS